MRECLSCGRKNLDEAQFCAFCGKSMADHLALGEPIGPTCHTAPLRDEFKCCAAKARRFLMMLAVLLALPVALILGGWVGQNGFAPSSGGLALAFYVCLLYGFMVGKTAQSAGASFLSHFALGCLPPLAPAAWARLTGVKPYKPYLGLLIDGLVLGGGIFFLQNYPYLVLALSICVLPFMVNHLLGGSVGNLAGLLGLPPLAAGAWLCLGPSLFLLLLTWQFFDALGAMAMTQPLSLTLTEAKVFLNLNAAHEFTPLEIIVIIYLMVTAGAWVKVTYENLKLPLV